MTINSTILKLMILLGLCMKVFAQPMWSEPEQIFPDSIHVYEIPQQMIEGFPNSLYMLARIGDSSAVIELSGHNLENMNIIAVADTMWSLSTPAGDRVSWREFGANKIAEYNSSTSSTDIYSIPDSFQCIAVDETDIYLDALYFFGITSGNNFVRCHFDRSTYEITGSVITDEVPPAEGYLKIGYGGTATYISSFSPPEFVVIASPTFETYSGKYPIMIDGGSTVAYTDSSPDILVLWDGLWWPEGYITRDSIEEKWLSYFLWFPDDVPLDAMVYASEGNVIVYSENPFSEYFENVFEDVNPTYVGVAGITLPDTLTPDSWSPWFWTHLWVFWTDSSNTLLGSRISERWSDIDEEPTVPDHFSLSAHPNPFNSAVSFTIDGAGVCNTPLRVEIYDVAGRKIKTDVGEALVASRNVGSGVKEREGTSPAPTENAVVWHPAPSLGSGVYLIRIQQDGRTYTKPVVYVK